MTNPFDIQRADDDRQLAEIRALAHAIWHEHYPGIIRVEQIEYMLDRMYTLDALRAGRDHGSIAYDVARSDSTPIGYAAYGPEPDSSEPKLFSLYVRSDWRGRGCGAALLGRAVAWARERRASTLMLTVNKRNRLAISAYERYGFRTREPIVTDIGGGFVMDDYVMELPLEPDRP